jgi:hypothetical protein
MDHVKSIVLNLWILLNFGLAYELLDYQRQHCFMELLGQIFFPV